jgi:hypothetical protein
MSAPTRGIERHPRSLTDPLFAAYTDATLELRASPHATASVALALASMRILVSSVGAAWKLTIYRQYGTPMGVAWRAGQV